MDLRHNRSDFPGQVLSCQRCFC